MSSLTSACCLKLLLKTPTPFLFSALFVFVRTDVHCTQQHTCLIPPWALKQLRLPAAHWNKPSTTNCSGKIIYVSLQAITFNLLNCISVPSDVTVSFLWKSVVYIILFKLFLIRTHFREFYCYCMYVCWGVQRQESNIFWNKSILIKRAWRSRHLRSPIKDNTKTISLTVLHHQTVTNTNCRKYKFEFFKFSLLSHSLVAIFK